MSIASIKSNEILFHSSAFKRTGLEGKTCNITNLNDFKKYLWENREGRESP